MRPPDTIHNAGSDQPLADPLGLEAWCASASLELHVGAALVATILSNTAAVSYVDPTPFPSTSLPGLNFSAVAGNAALEMALAALTYNVTTHQDALVMKSREHTAKELDDVMYGAFRSAKHQYLDKLREPEQDRSRDVEHLLNEDMRVSMEMVSYEAISRPKFFLKGSIHPNPSKYLLECLNGIGFVIGQQTLPGDPGKFRAAIEESSKLLNGAERSRAGAGISTKVTTQNVLLRGVFSFSSGDFDRLVGGHREFLRHAMPLVTEGSVGADVPVDDLKALRFMVAVNRKAVYALACRRGRAPLRAAFHSEEATAEFLKQQRLYLKDLADLPAGHTIHQMSRLPATMAWALNLLAEKNDFDDYVISTVFEAAWRLHAAAIRVFDRHDNKSLGERRMVVARKLLARQAKLGPSKRRELLRGLDRQSLDLHGPVISALIASGVLAEGPDKLLHAGRVPFRRIRPEDLIVTPDRHGPA